MTNIIHNILLSNNMDKNILQEESFDRYFFLNFNTLDEIHNYFIYITKTICSNLEHNKSNDKYEKIFKYIQSNYHNPLTATSIAEKFYMNTNYLGQLIKKNTGQTFNQYINTLRIEHAKQILKKNPEVKLTELANSIGYADPQYFSKVFSKITGYTPTQFKHKQ